MEVTTTTVASCTDFVPTVENALDRASILDTAKSHVCRDRQATYDTPERNFERIAIMWSAYKGVPFVPADVAAMMALVKIARLVTSPMHIDNWVDLAGYAACGGECATESGRGSVGSGADSAVASAIEAALEVR